MIGENLIALDTLSADKHIAKDLTSAIVETGNRNLKETFKQLRNQIEQEHEEIYQLAEQNGWYMAAGQADPQQVSEFNNFFNQSFYNNQAQMQYQQNQQNQQSQNNYQKSSNQQQTPQQPTPQQQTTPQYTYQGDHNNS